MKTFEEIMQDIHYQNLLFIQSLSSSINFGILILCVLFFIMWLFDADKQKVFGISENHDCIEDEMYDSDDSEGDPTDTSESNQSTITNDSFNEVPPSDDSINIKLMFLDDSIIKICANIQETIADLKSKHFSSELSTNKTVSLVFNGKDLIDESTVQSNGLHNNCAIQCLIQPIRNGTNSEQTNGLVDSDDTAELIEFLYG